MSSLNMVKIVLSGARVEVGRVGTYDFLGGFGSPVLHQIVNKLLFGKNVIKLSFFCYQWKFCRRFDQTLFCILIGGLFSQMSLFWQIAFLVSFQRIFAQIESDVMPHLIWTSTRILKKCQIFACICYIERVYRFKRLAQEIDARAISYLCEIIFPLHFNAEGFKVGNHRISTDASSATTSAKGRKSTSTYKLCKAMWHSQGKSTCKEGRKKKKSKSYSKIFL